MLSAGHRAAGVEAADVAKSAEPRKLVAPNVAGSWSVVGTGQISATGTVTLTQKGAKVTADINIEGLPPIHSTGKFTKAHDHQIEGHAKVSISGHTVKLSLTITFGEGATPTTFSGNAKAFGETIESFTGTKV